MTLSRTARGLPRPTIRLIKENASYPLQSNPRARFIQDRRTIRSQVFINGVKMEDYAKDQCVANNSVVVKRLDISGINMSIALFFSTA